MNIEILLYAVKFKTARGVEIFLKAMEKRGSGPGDFLYAKNRFHIPVIPDTHRLVVESMENVEFDKDVFPYTVQLLIAKNGP